MIEHRKKGRERGCMAMWMCAAENLKTERRELRGDGYG